MTNFEEVRRGIDRLTVEAAGRSEVIDTPIKLTILTPVPTSLSSICLAFRYVKGGIVPLKQTELHMRRPICTLLTLTLSSSLFSLSTKNSAFPKLSLWLRKQILGACAL